MRVKIPSGLERKSLFNYLVDNKDRIIKEKKSMAIKSDSFSFPYDVASDAEALKAAKSFATKAEGDQAATLNAGEAMVKFVVNTALWADSHLDVLGIDAPKKSIKERGPDGVGLIYHLKDHGDSTCDRIGYPKAIYTSMMTLADLGIKMPNSNLLSTQVVIFESLVKKTLSEELYQQYIDKEVKQHSVGIQYVQIELCINDPEYKDEFAAWGKYYPLVLNKSVVDESGYFWFVAEYKLFEGSAVLWGSNIVTPMLSDEDDDESEYKSTQRKRPETDSTENVDLVEYLSKNLKFKPLNQV